MLCFWNACNDMKQQRLKALGAFFSRLMHILLSNCSIVVVGNPKLSNMVEDLRREHALLAELKESMMQIGKGRSKWRGP